MSTKFTAPVGADSKKLDVDKIGAGMQLCTFYGLVDVGTQETNYGAKRQVYLCFEFPQEMRVFWEGDDPKPSAIFTKETLSMHEKANLRRTFIEPMSDKSFTDTEAANFDMSTLLGKHFVGTIRHTPDGKYANMVSVSPLDEKNKNMFGLQSLSVPQINDTMFYHLSMGFDCENFANLPKFLREQIMNSEEGRAHAAKGGTFAEPSQKSTPSKPSNPVGKKVIMNPDSQYTYEQLKQGGWTDEQIVENNYGKWSTPVEAPKPLPPTPSVPSPGSPVAPPAAPPAAPAKPKLVMKDPNAKIEDWLAGGWTEETLVEHGHAYFQ